MAATRALIRRGVRGLHLVCVPTSGLQADLLIGAGCVAALETSAVTLGKFGAAPRFTAAAKAAVPAIQELLDDTKSKFVAELALKKINGKEPRVNLPSPTAG